MPLLVRAYPLIVPVEELQAFVEQASTSRREDTSRMYRMYGVSHESWYLQNTPAGPWVISVAKVDDPAEAGGRYAASTEAHDVWFKEMVRKLSGVDGDRQPLGPPTTQVFAWSDDRLAASDLCART